MGTAILSFFGLIAALGITPATASYQQPDDQFRAALENNSTSPSFILITIRDARDGSARTGCTLAPFLLGAIHKENALPYNEEGQNAALRIAASARDHFFTFRRLKALANIALNDDTPRFQQACAIVRSGGQAYMSDRSGEIRTGLPNYQQ